MLFRSRGRRRQPAVANLQESIPQSAALTVPSVSYTHLDVYKRQALVDRLDPVVQVIDLPAARKLAPHGLVQNAVLMLKDEGLHGIAAVSYTHLPFLRVRDKFQLYQRAVRFFSIRNIARYITSSVFFGVKLYTTAYGDVCSPCSPSDAARI